MKIHVISTGYNQSQEQIDRLVHSVLPQEFVCELSVRLHIYNETDEDRRGAAFRRYEIMRNNPCPMIRDEDIIAIVDLDDYLLPGSLQKIAERHMAGAWVTYGNWQNQHGAINKLQIKWDGRPLRNGSFFLTHLTTFRAGLFRRIPIERLQIHGEWPMYCTDVERMYAVAEMAGPERTQLITEPLYHYNERLPSGTLAQFGKVKKGEMLRIIQSRPAFKQIEML